MPKVSPLQSDFSAGELSPLVYGRVDADRYKKGLETCQNYLPMLQGGLVRRSGTTFVSAVKDSTKKVRLQAFEFSTTQAYMLEFGDQYIRFYKDNALITLTAQDITGITKANPAVVTYSGADTYANGDKIIISGVLGMVEVNNREFTVANVNAGANTFELSGVDSSSYTTYTSGGTVAEIYEVTSTYVEADLFNLGFTQSNDVLYIVHPSYAPRKLTRTAHTSWTLSTITFVDGPFLDQNTTGDTLQPSATSGSGVTLTASTAMFASTDVGRLIRFMDGSNTWFYMTITGYTDSTHVTVTISTGTLAGTGARSTWRLGVWSATTGYPGTVVFHEDRLCFGGVTNYPQRIDMSETGSYESFSPTEASGTIVDSNAVSFSLNSNDTNVIRWMTSDEKGMLVGTSGGEWVVRPSSQAEAISPTNISAKRATSSGSARVSPIQSGKATLFVQRAGRKLEEMAYFYDVDGFRISDMTVLSEHITSGGIVQVAHQKEPQPIVWAVRNDGVLLGMTYDRDLDALKVGWHRHIVGGYGDSAQGDAIVESVAVIPAADGTRDEVWLSVKRYINGGTKRYIEYLNKNFEDSDELRDAEFVDSSLTYDSPVTITGATKANPVVITATAHGFSNGDTVLITDVSGMTELNTETFTVANKTANTFELSGIDGTSYTTYISGGEVRKYVSSISGLYHLAGETVSILADGSVQPDTAVSSLGVLTLPRSATTVHIGFGYTSRGKMLRTEAGAADGTALGKVRRNHRVGFLLHRTLGFQIGTDFDNLTELTFRTADDPLTRAVGLFSGIRTEPLESGYDTENQICWQQDTPLPGTILAVMPQMVTQDRG